MKSMSVFGDAGGWPEGSERAGLPWSFLLLYSEGPSIVPVEQCRLRALAPVLSLGT